MKKYVITFILGLVLGCCFAKAAYGQENYFTPQQTMKAAKESEVNNNKEDNDVSYFYYKHYKYPYYVEITDSLETKYALGVQNVKYSDVDFTLTYLQPYIVYDDEEFTLYYILVLLDCIVQNRATVVDMIDYCRLMGYEDELIQTLQNFVYAMEITHSYIKDCGMQYIYAYSEENWASCIKNILAIENAYWELYIKIGSIENPDGKIKMRIQTTQTIQQESEE